MYIGDIFTRNGLYIFTLHWYPRINVIIQGRYWQCFLTAFYNPVNSAPSRTLPPRTLFGLTPSCSRGYRPGTQILYPLRLTRGHFSPRGHFGLTPVKKSQRAHSAPRDPRPRATHDPARTATHDQHDAEDEEQNAQGQIHRGSTGKDGEWRDRPRL